MLQIFLLFKILESNILGSLDGKKKTLGFSKTFAFYEVSLSHTFKLTACGSVKVTVSMGQARCSTHPSQTRQLMQSIL